MHDVLLFAVCCVVLVDVHVPVTTLTRSFYLHQRYQEVFSSGTAANATAVHQHHYKSSHRDGASVAPLAFLCNGVKLGVLGVVRRRRCLLYVRVQVCDLGSFGGCRKLLVTLVLEPRDIQRHHSSSRRCSRKPSRSRYSSSGRP